MSVTPSNSSTTERPKAFLVSILRICRFCGFDDIQPAVSQSDGHCFVFYVAAGAVKIPLTAAGLRVSGIP